MTLSPLALARPPDPPPRPPRRRIETATRRLPTRIARRRVSVGLAKRLLPLVALALLTTVALWPEFATDERGRLTYRVHGLEPESGQLTDVHYSGVDDRDRPYTMTASSARQISPERIDLVEPKGDMNLESGSWLMVQARRGVYAQHTSQLDLAGDVLLYRDDGLNLTTDTATLDLKAGAATSADRVHAEGPFGSLDAQGFTVTDRGTVVQFTGPGRLVLNAHERPQ